MLTDSDVDRWRGWIGRSETRSERLDAGALRRFAAAIGESLEVEAAWPSLGHWAFFLPVDPAAALGDDGHLRRGGFLPPVMLPRRMYAAGSLVFARPLCLGETAERRSTIRDVTHKHGRSGDLIIVTVEHVLSQNGTPCISEEQTIIYRDAGERSEPVAATPSYQPSADQQIWLPTEVDLFRFSAATFNSHRIHYDLRYVVDVEGYPGLVVHGPLTACRLFQLERQRSQRRPARWSFRATAPLICGQPVRLAATVGSTQAIRHDDVVAMTAVAGQ